MERCESFTYKKEANSLEKTSGSSDSTRTSTTTDTLSEAPGPSSYSSDSEYKLGMQAHQEKGEEHNGSRSGKRRSIEGRVIRGTKGS